MGSTNLTINTEIQAHLDILNRTSSLINNLEIQLNECRQTFNTNLRVSSNKLADLNKKLKKNIERSKKYFEIFDKRNDLLNQLRRNCQFYQQLQCELSSSKLILRNFDAAKIEDSDQSQLNLINLTNEKINSSKSQIQLLQTEHHNLLTQCREYDEYIRRQESSLSRSISKARPYFELKSAFSKQMQKSKEMVDQLTERVKFNKSLYSETMRGLESISNSIHESRGVNLHNHMNLPNDFSRSCGVGAECNYSTTEFSGVMQSVCTRSLSTTTSHTERTLSELSNISSTRRTPSGQADTDDDENLLVDDQNEIRLKLLELTIKNDSPENKRCVCSVETDNKIASNFYWTPDIRQETLSGPLQHSILTPSTTDLLRKTRTF